MSEPIDYAWRDRRTLFRKVLRWFWVSAAVAVVAALAWNWHRYEKVLAAKDHEWTISGPPCPASDGFPVSSSRSPKVHEIEFGGNTLVRRFGYVTCSYVDAIRHPMAVCQFSAPGALRVVTTKGTFNFAPGIGQRATITVRGGIPQCVVAGKL